MKLDPGDFWFQLIALLTFMPLLFGLQLVTGPLGNLPDHQRHVVVGFSFFAGVVGILHLFSRFQSERRHQGILERLRLLVPEFDQPWLFTENRLVEFEGTVRVSEVWIISPDLGKDVDTYGSPFEHVVRQNIAERKVRYTYIYPDTEHTRAKIPALRQLFSRRIEALRRCPLAEDVFRKLSVTHIAIFNPQMEQSIDSLTAYMELPVDGTPHWIRIENEAAKALVGRYQRVLESNRIFEGYQ